MKILAVIPARGGSKGIPRKNIRLLNGKPLLYYVIKTALNSIYITDVLVSTEDENIATIAKILGTEVVIRPKELAHDHVPLDPVIYYTLTKFEELRREKFDIVVTIQPTSPLLSSDTLDKAVNFMIKNPEYDTVIAVKDATHLYWMETEKGVKPLFKERKNRQYLPKVYVETGSFLISRRNIVTSYSRIGQKVHLFKLSEKEAVDIDSYKDWWIAENYLNQKKILFRVIGGKDIGLGHIYRAITLADRLSLQHKVYFAIEKNRNWGIEKIKEKLYPIYQFANLEEFEEIINKISPNILINDILDTDEPYMKWLRKKVKFIVNFEDLGEGAKYADIVINALYENSYPPQNHFYGYRYVCLRDEFLLFPPKRICPEVREILITFGGTDPNDLTLKFLESLRLLEKVIRQGSIRIKIVLGLGYKNEKKVYKIAKELASRGYCIDVKKNVQMMAKEIFDADIVVTSNGRTIYEAASLGVPIISISQNERELKHLFTYTSGGVLHLGIACNVTIEKIATSLKKLIMDFELRKKMSNNLKKFDLKKGIERVINLIFTEFERKIGGKI